MYNQEENIIGLQLCKFLNKYYQEFVDLIPLKCTHELESDQLQLLKDLCQDDMSFSQNQQSQGHLQYNQCDYKNMFSIVYSFLDYQYVK